MTDNRSLSNPTPCFLDAVQWDLANPGAVTLSTAAFTGLLNAAAVLGHTSATLAPIEYAPGDSGTADYDYNGLAAALGMGDDGISLLLRAWKTEQRPAVRRSALDLLGRVDVQGNGVLDKPDVVNAMEQAINASPDDPATAETALRYLVWMDPGKVTPGMKAGLLAQVKTGQPLAALALGRLGDPMLVPALEPALGSGDKAMVELAKLAITRLGDERYLAELLRQVESNDVNVRTGAFAKLAYAGKKAAVGRIAPFLSAPGPAAAGALRTPYRYLAAWALSMLVEDPPVKKATPESFTEQDVAAWLSWWQRHQSQYPWGTRSGLR
jgi:HEAT repeat protein